jgi:hypothetical protein
MRSRATAGVRLVPPRWSPGCDSLGIEGRMLVAAMSAVIAVKVTKM